MKGRYRKGKGEGKEEMSNKVGEGRCRGEGGRGKAWRDKGRPGLDRRQRSATSTVIY